MPATARPRDAALLLDPLVLVAEDEQINQLLMRAALIKAGCNAKVATDGAEAVDLVFEASASDYPYSLVLMDLALPNIDGFEAARRIRAAGIGPDELPIVAFTARWDDRCAERCREAGMQDAIPKPLEIVALHDLVRFWCGRGRDDPPPSTSAYLQSPANDGVCPWPASSWSTTTPSLRRWQATSFTMAGTPSPESTTERRRWP